MFEIYGFNWSLTFQAYGKMIKCQANETTCQVTVRKNDGKVISYSSMCKQE